MSVDLHTQSKHKTQWLVRFIKMKRKSDLVLTVLFFVFSILAFVGFVSHLLEVRI